MPIGTALMKPLRPSAWRSTLWQSSQMTPRCNPCPFRIGSRVSGPKISAEMYPEIAPSYSTSQVARSRRGVAFECHATLTAKSVLPCTPVNLAVSTVTGNCMTIFPRRSERLAKLIGTQLLTASDSSCKRVGESNSGWNTTFRGSAHSNKYEPFQKLFLRTRFQGTLSIESGGTNCGGTSDNFPTCRDSPDPFQTSLLLRSSNACASSAMGREYCC